MRRLAVLDVAERLDDLEPAQMPKRFVGASDRYFDRVFDAGSDEPTY
jgi:hypothetical protein